MSLKKDFTLISMIQTANILYQSFGKNLSQMVIREKIVQLLVQISTISMTFSVVDCTVEFAILAQHLFSPSEVCVQNQDLIFIMVGMG